MDTIDIRRDPCADAILQGIGSPTGDDTTMDTTDVTTELPAWTPGRDRPIRYIQHPAFRQADRPGLQVA